MDDMLSPGSRLLLTRLGDGHGRRLLLLQPRTAPPGTPSPSACDDIVALAVALSWRAWAVCLCRPRGARVDTGTWQTEAAGVVVDWRVGSPRELPLPDRTYAVVACCTDPGLSDGRVSAELARVLVRDGLLVAALPDGTSVGEPAGFTGLTVSRRPGAVVVSARRTSTGDVS